MSHLRILGAALGDPASPFTYSGVPYHLFRELDARGLLAATANSLLTRRLDLPMGLLDLRRSLRERYPRYNSLWRFQISNIERLSRRFQALQRRMPAHNHVLQISGVGAIPLPRTPLVAHVEISVETAASLPDFAPQYGFARHSRRALARAMEGERYFLERCSLVVTNSRWCAQGLLAQGLPPEKLRIQAPAAGIADPGPLERPWERCQILFIGLDWRRKGGPLLVEAFRRVRAALPQARLTIVGCRPDVGGDGIEVVGILRKDDPAHRRQLEGLLRQSTIFCMPSHWESTGLVYMEAALYGLPVVMLSGQGRQEIFPPTMAEHVERHTPGMLADCLIDLARDPDRMRAMGRAGRRHVLDHYTWPVVAEKVAAWMADLDDTTPPAALTGRSAGAHPMPA